MGCWLPRIKPERDKETGVSRQIYARGSVSMW
jgi:hypothetical protein